MMGHDSPESAALAGFPAAHCRVVESRAFGDDAYVLLDTGPAGHPYLYGCTCHRKDGRWFELSSGNGPGWAPASDDADAGMLTFWGDLPAGVDMVRVDFDGTVSEEPVRA